MKIALAQLNYKIGDFERNYYSIVANIEKAKANKADLVVFSELSVCGYPPLDLLEHRTFVEKSLKYTHEIARHCDGIAAVIGGPDINNGKKGKNLYNSAFFCCDGDIKYVINKSLLPTYDIFDEYRYFEPNSEFQVIEYKNCRIAVTICEDLWYHQPVYNDFGKSKLYNYSPMKELSALNPDIVLNISASPFSSMHEKIKKQIFIDNIDKFHVPIVYLNQVGAHTELIFDGGSMVINGRGGVIREMKPFEEDFGLVDTEEMEQSTTRSLGCKKDIISKIHDALVLGIKDYFVKMGFKTATLGLSGGIDSAVSLALAVNALGKDNLHVLLLPSQYSSDHSVTDAEKLAVNLGVKYDIIPIKDLVNEFDKALKPLFKGLPVDIAEENIQARIRGTLLMALSNKFGNILLNTSNKSETAVGYGTLYGDMNGGLSVLGDVYKTDVYKLAKYINRQQEMIPDNILQKPPSAELRPDQKDTDSLPEYDLLDNILYNYIELQEPVEDIVKMGYDKSLVEKIIHMVNKNEHKRYQTPPILRISSKAFGSGRRMPLVANYD